MAPLAAVLAFVLVVAGLGFGKLGPDTRADAASYELAPNTKITNDWGTPNKYAGLLNNFANWTGVWDRDSVYTGADQMLLDYYLPSPKASVPLAVMVSSASALPATITTVPTPTSNIDAAYSPRNLAIDSGARGRTPTLYGSQKDATTSGGCTRATAVTAVPQSPGLPRLGVAPGATFCVPSANTTNFPNRPGTQNQWNNNAYTGMTISQNTGNLYFTTDGYANTAVSGSYAGYGDYTVMVFDPAQQKVVYEPTAVRAVPDAYRKVGINSGATGNAAYVGGQGAVDANDNLYTVISANSGQYLARISPPGSEQSRKAGLPEYWTWNPLMKLAADKVGFGQTNVRNCLSTTNASNWWGLAFSNGSMYSVNSTCATGNASTTAPLVHPIPAQQVDASITADSYGGGAADTWATNMFIRINTSTGLASQPGDGSSRPNGSAAAATTGQASPVSGRMLVGGGGTAGATYAHDAAAPQAAPVVSGTVHVDPDGSGNTSAPASGVTVGVYQAGTDGSGLLLGTQVTGDDGFYSFLVPTTTTTTPSVVPAGVVAGKYYVRVIQPQVGGVNAVQTYAGDNSGSTVNTVTPLCDGQASAAGACGGNLLPPYADPPAGESGSVIADFAASVPVYSTVTMADANEVIEADFGISTEGSYGDAPAGPTTGANVPVHVNGPNPVVWLGDQVGAYPGPVSDQSHSTDDGVYLVGPDGAKIALQGSVLAATKQYTLAATVSGDRTDAKVTGWTTAASATPASAAWTAAPAWKPELSGDTATGTFQYQTTNVGAATPTGQLRAQVSSATITAPTNASGQYQAAQGNATDTWTTPGEIEDYSFTLADSVYRVGAKTTSGTGTFQVGPQANLQSVTANAATTTVAAKAFGQAAGQAVTVKANVPNSAWSVTGVKVVDTVSGQDVTSQVGGVWDKAGDTMTFTPRLTDDLTVVVTYTKEPDPDKSKLELFVDSDLAQAGASQAVHGDLYALVTVSDAEGAALAGREVTFANATPAKTTLSATTCVTNANGQCAVRITSEDAGTYEKELAATIDISGTATAVKNSPATVTFTSVKADPKKSALTVTTTKPGAAKVIADGTDSWTATVVVKDSSDRYAVGQEVAFKVLDPGTGAEVSAATVSGGGNCTTDAQGSCSVTVVSQQAGTVKVSALVTPLGGGEPVDVNNSPASVEFVAGPVDLAKSSLSVSSGTALAGGSVTATVTAVDAFDNPVLGAAFELSVSGTPTGPVSATFGGAATTNCVTAVSGANQGKCSVTVTDAAAESVDVHAAFAGAQLNDSPRTVVFSPAAVDPDSSTFTVAMTSGNSDATKVIANGTDSWTGTLTLRDGTAAHNPVAGIPASQLAITASSPAVQASSVSDNGDGTYTVTFTTKKAAAYTASAALDSIAIGSDRPIPFAAGPVDPTAGTTGLSVAPTQVKVGGTSTAKVTTTDADGNLVGGVRVDFGVDKAAGFVGDAFCVTAASGAELGTCSVTVTDAKAQTVTVSAKIAGVALTASPTVEFTADVFDPAKSAFLVQPTSGSAVVADGVQSWTATLTAKDGLGNELSSLDPAKVLFAVDEAVAVSGVTNHGDGTYTATLTSKKADSFPVTAKYDSVPTADSPASVVFVAGEPDAKQSTLAVDETSVIVGASVTATVTIKDANGNAASGRQASVTASKSGSVVGVCVTNTFGVCAVQVTDTVAETVDLAATIGGQDVTGSPVTVTFGYGEVDPDRSKLQVSPAAQLAGSPVTVTVTVTDVSGNGVAGLSASQFTVTGKSAGLPELVLSSFTDQGNGVYRYTTTSKDAGTFNLVGQVSGTMLKQKPDVTFTAGAVCVGSACQPTPNNSGNITRFEVTTDNRIANGSSANQVTARAYDAYGNPVSGAQVTVVDQTTGELAGALKPVSAGGVTTGPNGLATVGFTSAKAGQFQVEGTIDTARPATGAQTLSFVPGSVDPAKSVLAVSPNQVTVGSSVTATVTAKDSFGNPVGGVTVMLGSDSADVKFGGSGSETSASCTTQTSGAALGTCQVKLTSRIAGSHKVTASVGGAQLGGSPAAVRFTTGPACFTDCDPVDPAKVSRVEVTKNGSVDNGVDADVATVWVFDRYGNPVPGAAVASAAVTSTLTVKTPEVATDADGVAKVSYTSKTKGSAVARITAEGTELGVTASRTGVLMWFAGGPADPEHSSVSVDPMTPQRVDQPFTVTAVVNDGSDQPVEHAVVSFSASAGVSFVGGASCVTDADGRCAVTVTSTKAGSYQVGATIPDAAGVPKALSASPVGVVFTAEKVCVAPCVPDVGVPVTEVRLTTDGVLADGKSRDVATVWAYDRHGNPVPDAVVASQTTDAGLSTQPSIAKTGGNGQTTVWYTSLIAGPHQASVTVAGQAPTGSSLRPVFAAVPASAENSSFTVTPALAGASTPLVVGTADESSYVLTATANNEYGVPVAGTVVSFQIAPNGPTWADQTTCVTGADGKCSVRVRSTVSGSFAVTANLGADPIGSAKPASWKAGAACMPSDPVCTAVDPSVPAERRSRVVVTTDGQLADGSQQDVVTVYAFDSYGNPAVGALVRSAKADAADSLTVQSDVRSTDDNGRSTVYYQSTVAGSHEAFVTVDGGNPAGSPVRLRFVPGSVDPAMSVLTVAPDQVTVGDTVIATVTAKDSFGNPVGSVAVVFGSDSDDVLFDGSAAQKSCVTAPSGAAQGICQVKLTSQEAGSYQVIATVPDTAGLARAARPVQGSPATVVFAAAAPAPQKPIITTGGTVVTSPVAWVAGLLVAGLAALVASLAPRRAGE